MTNEFDNVTNKNIHVVTRSSIGLAAFGLIAGFVAAWPPLHLILVNANLASYYPDNIGFRFFWALRFVEGVPGDFVHPGQGVLLSLIQSVYYLTGKWLGLDLFGQINLFQHLTVGVPATAMLLLALFMAFDRKIDVGVRAALVSAPLVMAFGGPQMFSYDVYPDYIPYTKVFFLLFGWRWLHHRGWEGFASSRAVIELGLLAGLIGALKINYVVWPGGLLLGSLIVMTATQKHAFLRAAVLVGLSAAIAMLGPFFLHYRGSLPEIFQFFNVVFNFGSSLAGSSDFSISLFPEANVVRAGGPATGDPHATESTLAWLLLVFVALSILGVVERLRFGPITLRITMAMLAGVAVAMAYLRGGGSSYFDAVVMLSILCAMMTATFQNRPIAKYAPLLLAAVFTVWPAAWVSSNWRAYATISVSGHESLLKLGEVGDWQRKLHDWNLSHGLPVYVLTPTNYYTQGTIEDLIVMGFTNFRAHTESANRNPARLALFPQFNFLYFANVRPNPSYRMSMPPERVVFMQIVGKPGPDFPQLDQKVLDQHKQEVDDLLRGRRREQCYTVRHVLTGVDIVSCVLSAPE